MAQEGIRGCGYRKVGGLYLVGAGRFVSCDRLPYPLDICPVCGGGIKVSRAFTKINPLKLFGLHDVMIKAGPSQENDNRDTMIAGYGRQCMDIHRPCPMCDPTDSVAFIMRVGEKHYPTPQDFMTEAMSMGISKRIPWKPKELKLGVTLIYLSHARACQVEIPAAFQKAFADNGPGATTKLLDAPSIEKKQGIFATFVPQRIEKLIWEKDATKETLAGLEKQGITPVIIKPDADHS